MIVCVAMPSLSTLPETTTSGPFSAARVSRWTLAWGVPALVFLIPWGARLIFFTGRVNGQPVEALTFSLFAIETLVFVAAVTAVPELVSRLRERQRWTWFFLAFVVWVFLSILWAPVPLLALQAAVRLLAAALLFLLVCSCPDRERVINAFLLSVVCQAMLGLFQFFTQQVAASTLLGVATQSAFGPSAVVESVVGRLLRAYGTLSHPNIFGGFMAVGLVMSLFPARGRVAHLFRTGAAPLLAAGLFVSFSRSAWLAAVAGVVAVVVSVALRQVSWRPVFLRIGAACLIAGLFVALYLPFVNVRVTATGRLETRSINERLLALEQSRDLLLDRPLVGVGIGQTIPALLAKGGEYPPLLEPPHAAPAVLLVELGIVGFLLAVGLLLRFVPRGSVLSPEAVALAATGGVLMLFDHYLWTAVPGLLLAALLLALLLDRRSSTP